jgi:hypothetical protein
MNFVETSEGKLVDASAGSKARYVRSTAVTTPTS